ncbi:hypothetical protein CEXT_580801 [Caerostris extrusa]|uniref:Uncharacterized protein n=1 Tax=Caerostris extrusa TaxID=172846 RepID=A0AAV4V353_CAEEX|nr:hypothetical protein CEXT_580801 [Caerostris extrusa]
MDRSKTKFFLRDPTETHTKERLNTGFPQAFSNSLFPFRIGEIGGEMQNVCTSLQFACPECIIRESIVCDDNLPHSLGPDHLILVLSRAFRF